MSAAEKLREELKKVASLSAFFGAWFLALLAFKTIVLSEYEIHFWGVSAALIGALVVAKVVLVLENIKPGPWMRRRPGWVHVVARTVLYTMGVGIVLLLEKSLDGRAEYGGLVSSMKHVLEHRDAHHVLANTLCVSGALLVFNAFSVVRAHLGGRDLIDVFADPLPELSRNEPGRVPDGKPDEI